MLDNLVNQAATILKHVLERYIHQALLYFKSRSCLVTKSRHQNSSLILQMTESQQNEFDTLKCCDSDLSPQYDCIHM